ncbi:MAG: serine protease [Rhodobacteraceae bacterium]|nr:serine protease [Paracoccaceae bacterium]
MKAQLLLQALGFDLGKADGVYGEKTKAAVEAYQARNRMPIDGAITPILIGRLDADVKQGANRSNEAIAAPDSRNLPDHQVHKAPSLRSAVKPATQLGKGLNVTTPFPTDISHDSLSPADLFASVKGSVWVVVAAATIDALSTKAAQGSAVAISKTKLITNCHVVKDGPVIGLIQGKQVLEAVLDSARPEADRCVLSTAGRLHPVRGVRRFDDLGVGERVYTVGAPRGLDSTLGEGLISGLRQFPSGNYVQTTAPISPGSSGGGLFDERGNLIGVTTFLLRESQALNFAIAADDYWR